MQNLRYRPDCSVISIKRCGVKWFVQSNPLQRGGRAAQSLTSWSEIVHFINWHLCWILCGYLFSVAMVFGSPKTEIVNTIVYQQTTRPGRAFKKVKTPLGKTCIICFRLTVSLCFFICQYFRLLQMTMQILFCKCKLKFFCFVLFRFLFICFFLFHSSF